MDKRKLLILAKAIPAHVPEPDAAFSYSPVYIADDGDGTFSVFNKASPYGAFDLQAHANITVAKTYYVAITGSDATGDGTSEKPFATLAKALTKTDYDRIYIGAGRYRASASAYNPTRNCEIIGVGSVFLVSDLYGSLGAFTLVDSHYETATAYSYISKVCDLSTTDSDGYTGLTYTKKASIAEVDATAGSWYWASNVLYVHTFDGRAPDSNICYVKTGSGFNASTSGKKFYLENINFVGGSTFTNVSLYAKSCTFDGYYGHLRENCISFTGATSILQNCTVIRAGQDGIQAPVGTSNGIEIDCTILHCGFTGADNFANGSSYHGGYVIRINGDYGYTFGAPIADAVNAGRSWNLGVHIHDNIGTGSNTQASNIYADAAHDTLMWCDQCVSTNPKTYDYANSGLHKHNCTGEATDYGSPEAYDY